MTKSLIYVVEDESHIQQLVKYNLEKEGYRVKAFGNGESFLQETRLKVPELFLLDIMLPDIDGLELCKLLRKNPATHKVPIILLTAKGEEFDKVLGLEIGADDYITKPFSIREMIARVKAVLRRVTEIGAEEEEEIRQGDIVMNCSRREVYKGSRQLDLTLKEFELLKLLLLNKGRVLSRDMLLEKIWGYEYQGETRTVDVHIRYLRQKIEEDDNNPLYIETVRGIGYRFSDKVSRTDSETTKRL
ncbi:two component transcriptional regulator, winged helix family [Syntrophobotulus glycolicus DSM 8271]|uniref:Stage 0 sporulation protein A homolog n=1 Tax=Syntrophobotulus glycolicus (strain DSM 8271 / FlGlyR) TaxID=645991 RepID=F0SVN0_SYNGF|nr:response regulator transcription factor [Syntrophobotulus glycolicus]ADY54506.1 two component transcriptional regulator, winged helix family [Syntrophobotulus glycolicus DSM 8271]